MSSDSTPSPRRRQEPPRPRYGDPDFPLGVHKATGYFVKKVRGRQFYFGKLADDPTGEAALAQWEYEREDLEAGRDPRAGSKAFVGSITVDALCVKFLDAKKAQRDTDELTPRAFADYVKTCKEVTLALGRRQLVAELTPDDFRRLKAKLQRPTPESKKRGLLALATHMQRTKTLFKFAHDEKLIETPVHYGQGFKKPIQKKIDGERENHREEHGEMMFESHELRAILAKLNDRPCLRAMILMAANCAFGQTDLAKLPVNAVKLDTAWVAFARVKTGVGRKIPLWQETVAAICDWLKVRPKPASDDEAKLMFLSPRGRALVRDGKTGRQIDDIGPAFTAVLAELGLQRSRRGLYALRHTFETIGGETFDQVAVDALMGHKDGTMASHYRERIADDRLVRVVEHVRRWLFDGSDIDPTGAKTKVADLRTVRTSVLDSENPPGNHDKPGTQDADSSTQESSKYALSQGSQSGKPVLRIVG